MACNRVRLGDLGKLRKKYPLVRNLPRVVLVSNTEPEIENIIYDVISLSDTIVINFSNQFSGIPSVIASFISPNSYGNVNVYVTNISISSVTVCTSAPVTGKIIVQAIYIEGCSAIST